MSRNSEFCDKYSKSYDNNSRRLEKKNEMDILEQLRQDVLRIRREKRYDKYPPKMTVDEDGDVFFHIPKEFYENKTAESEDLKLIGEIKLFDDPLIPIMFSFYYDD